MPVSWLLERMDTRGADEALVWREQSFSHAQLLDLVAFWRHQLAAQDVQAGHAVALEGDYSPNACALMLALIERGAIIVPLTRAAQAQREELLATAETQVVISFDDADGWTIERSGITPSNPLTRRLIDAGKPGLVLFSSGSTGKTKAALHDFTALLKKFTVPRHAIRTVTFLLLDHIGGINTLLYTLANGGAIVTVPSRDPEVVCEAIERHRVELLPTSPTFLNMLLISEAYRRHDVSSLRLITYGTEVMPESTLKRVHELFPNVRLLQTYGLSELGILRSKSRESDSLWVKVGGEGFETKVVDGTLWVRAESAMLGYLNAPRPFDADGWMNTGDVVDVDGEYVRIHGRRTEIINVGGEKVYPAEVESVLLQMDNVRDATVRAERNAITGNVVAAHLNLVGPEDPKELRQRVRRFCRERLAPYKVPVKIVVVNEDQFGPRYKRMRRAATQQPA